jgi:hypothetical protein
LGGPETVTDEEDDVTSPVWELLGVQRRAARDE